MAHIYLASPHMSEEGYEQQYVKEAFDTNWIAPLGKNANEFEKEFASYVGANDGAALSAGTAAIHLALKAAGIKKGDIVFCQDLTFSATANPIIYEDAVPVFIDSDYETWNMSPDALERAFEKYPDVKAVMPVHLYGLPANMDRIMEICNAHHVPVIEDAAESLGTIYHGQKTGTFGDYGCFSFNGNKIITGSSGGCLLTNDISDANHARKWSTQARENAAWYQHEEVGYNYRMTNVQACLGLAQLERLEGFVETKKARYDQYKAALDGVHGLRILPFKEESDGVRSNHWFYSLYLKDSGLDRDTVIAKLQDQGIQTRPVWALINEQADYPKNEAYALEKAQDYRKYIVNLPCSTNLTEQDCERVIAAVKNL